MSNHWKGAPLAFAFSLSFFYGADSILPELLTNESSLSKGYIAVGFFKGTVSQYFLLQVFSMNYLPPRPRK